MEDFDLSTLEKLIRATVPVGAPVTIIVSAHENGGLHIRVDGPDSANNIGIWPNGCFDIEYVVTRSGESHVEHHVFNSFSQVVSAANSELQEAIARAGGSVRA